MPSNTSDTMSLSKQPVEFVLDDTLLGEGTFSEVRLAQNASTKEYVAAKMTDLTKNRRYYDKEVRALTTIPLHKNIIPLVQYGEDGSTGYIFTQYTEAKTLWEYVNLQGGLTEEESLNILDQLVDGLEAVHKARFSHNDLKPENVLYNPSTQVAHIFDFGLSTPLEADACVNECCGSPLYMAPEVLTQSTSRHNPVLSDIWSLGLIFYYVLVGDLPWPGVDTLRDLVQAVAAGRLYIPRHVSHDARELLAGMLQLTPTSRWSLERIKKHVRGVLARWKSRRNFPTLLPANMYTRF